MVTEVVQPVQRPVERSEVVLWFVAVGFLSVVTGLGTVAAAVLVITRLRPCSRRVRVGLVTFSVLTSVLVLALVIAGLQMGTAEGEFGPVFEVDPVN